MKFRKKPVVIDAEQYDNFSSAPMDGVCGYGCVCFESGDYCEDLHIHTLEGTMKVSHGDWVVKGVAGEFYPVKPSIFAATYEPVDESPAPAGRPS